MLSYMGYMSRLGTGARRLRTRRDELRAAGLRPVQIWVPDTRSSGFAAECQRQAQLVRDAEECEDAADPEAWAETSDTSGWIG